MAGRPGAERRAYRPSITTECVGALAARLLRSSLILRVYGWPGSPPAGTSPASGRPGHDGYIIFLCKRFHGIPLAEPPLLGASVVRGCRRRGLSMRTIWGRLHFGSVLLATAGAMALVAPA